jgi:DNA-directed RNA polymerase specialized sigma24 family protein
VSGLTPGEARAAICPMCAAASEAAATDEQDRDVAFEGALRVHHGGPAERAPAYLVAVGRREVSRYWWRERRRPETVSLNGNGAIELQGDDGDVHEFTPARLIVGPHDDAVLAQVDAEHHASRREELVHALLSRLTVRERRAVLLRYMLSDEITPVATIAAEMGIGAPRVSQLVHAALRRLRAVVDTEVNNEAA